MQHTATHYYTLQHTTTHYYTLQHTATHCNTLLHTATHYYTLQHTTTHCYTLLHTTTHCYTLLATHCNTLNAFFRRISSNEHTSLLIKHSRTEPLHRKMCDQQSVPIKGCCVVSEQENWTQQLRTPETGSENSTQSRLTPETALDCCRNGGCVFLCMYALQNVVMYNFVYSWNYRKKRVVV